MVDKKAHHQIKKMYHWHVLTTSKSKQDFVKFIFPAELCLLTSKMISFTCSLLTSK
jgi:hypothetical protein